MQSYEESVSFLGTWGPFQRRVTFLLCLLSIPSGFLVLSIVLLLASPPHHCSIPAHSNLSHEWIQASIPVQYVARGAERSSCSRYRLDLLQDLAGNLSALNQSTLDPELLVSDLPQEACKDGWTYSQEYYRSTVVTEFDLVCSDQWKQPLTSLAFFMGALCGCFVSGQIADRFGRKPTLFGALGLVSIFSAAATFAPSWPVFTILFFMMGVGQISSYIIVFVLGSEILTGSTRVLFSTVCLPCTYTLSIILQPCVAYLVSNWRHQTLIMAVPSVAIIPLFWLIPESPRWLVSCGRLAEAEHLLRSAALENRVEPPLVIFPSANVEKTEIEKAESHSFLDLLRTKNIRQITLILWLIWTAFSVSYFGISFNASGLSGNPFLNYALLTAVEIPGYGCSLLAIRLLPRRRSYIGFMLLAALALLLIQVTMHSHPSVTLTLVLLGKFCIMGGIAVIYVYTLELFPTVIRNTAMSSCAMHSRLGSSLSPYVQQLAVFSQFLPWIVVGALLLLSIILCAFLPETFKQPLPDTIREMKPTQTFKWPWRATSLSKDDEKSPAAETMAPGVICSTHF